MGPMVEWLTASVACALQECDARVSAASQLQQLLVQQDAAHFELQTQHVHTLAELSQAHARAARAEALLEAAGRWPPRCGSRASIA